MAPVEKVTHPHQPAPRLLRPLLGQSRDTVEGSPGDTWRSTLPGAFSQQPELTRLGGGMWGAGALPAGRLFLWPWPRSGAVVPGWLFVQTANPRMSLCAGRWGTLAAGQGGPVARPRGRLFVCPRFARCISTGPVEAAAPLDSPRATARPHCCTPGPAPSLGPA